MAFSVQKTSPENPAPSSLANGLDHALVSYLRIDEGSDGQRLDNFLLRTVRGVPKSHVYQVIRSGEVRVNRRRASPETRLSLGDVVRIPPVRVSGKSPENRPAPAITESELPVLLEDRHLLIVSKPAGLAAHGGSGIAFGLIERLRSSRTSDPFLELAHRLDRDTSGVIVVCRTRKALVRFHEMQHRGEVEKHYRLLVRGDWVNDRQHIREPLARYTLASGERRVRVDRENGLASHTVFTLLRRYGPVSYLDAELMTGRTHQIRVHALSAGFPLVGDAKYGDYAWNDRVSRGLLGVPFSRMFLHAYKISFPHPVSGEDVTVTAPLPRECETLLETLGRNLSGGGAYD